MNSDLYDMLDWAERKEMQERLKRQPSLDELIINIRKERDAMKSREELLTNTPPHIRRPSGCAPDGHPRR